MLRGAFTVFSLAVIIGIALMRESGNFKRFLRPEPNIEVEDMAIEVTPSPGPILGSETAVLPTVVKKPMRDKEGSTPTTIPEPTVSSGSINLSDFQYPGARIVASTDKSLSLESTDDPDKVSDWYKEKLKQKNYNAKSIVETSTNGMILNKFQASGSPGTVTIEITKDANSSTTSVKISM
jgi:hypothetical protein